MYVLWICNQYILSHYVLIIDGSFLFQQEVDTFEVAKECHNVKDGSEMFWIDLDLLKMIEDMYLLLINVLQVHNGIIEIDECHRHFQEFAEEVVLAHTF